MRSGGLDAKPEVGMKEAESEREVPGADQHRDEGPELLLVVPQEARQKCHALRPQQGVSREGGGGPAHRHAHSGAATRMGAVEHLQQSGREIRHSR